MKGVTYVCQVGHHFACADKRCSCWCHDRIAVMFGVVRRGVRRRLGVSAINALGLVG